MRSCRMRIIYATYQAMAAMPGGERHVAFTRILHRGAPDALMQVRAISAWGMTSWA